LFDALLVRPTQSIERNGYKSEQTPLYRFLPELHKRFTVRSIVSLLTQGPHGPYYAVTLLERREPMAPMQAYLGFATARCPGADLSLTSALIPLDTTDAIIESAEELPPLASPHDAPLTDLRVVASNAKNVDRFTYNEGDTETSFLVGAPRGKLMTTDGATVGVLGRIEGLRAALAPAAGEPFAREDRPLFGTGWYPTDDGGAAFLSVHHAVIAGDRATTCKYGTPKKAFAPPQLTLRARLDASGLAIDSERVGLAYVVAIPEQNQPLAPIFEDKRHHVRSGPYMRTSGFAEAKAGWLFGLFSTKEAARTRLNAHGYTKGVIYAAPARGAAAPSDAPSTIAATLPEPVGPLTCDIF
jgi:hypothetical protein